MNNEMHKIFGISERHSGEVILQAFLELARKDYAAFYVAQILFP